MDQERLNALPLSIFSFEQIRKKNCIYVDKTRFVYQLASADRRIFLSRPRRFGKSLLVSTFESLFKNGLEYFEGLDIAQHWVDTTYPVVHLDFSEARKIKKFAEFAKDCDDLIADAFEVVGFERSLTSSSSLFRQLSKWLKGQPVSSLVLLIDEYDTPLTQCLNRPELFEEVRSYLSEFYAIVKGNDLRWRFVFITGIAKFAKMSIFSGMNNLIDISLAQEYGTILGYTEDEVLKYFGQYIDNAVGKVKQPKVETREAVLAELRNQYDGFCFDNSGTTRLYSPWSVLKFFWAPFDGFINYWYESGGQPTILTEFAKEHPFSDPVNFDKRKVIAKERLSLSSATDNLDELALLTQSGYLTIKADDGDNFILSYPNEEVRRSMARLYADAILNEEARTESRSKKFIKCASTESAEDIVHLFSKIVLGTTYTFAEKVDEAHIQALFGICFSMAGYEPHVEKQNAERRTDLEVKLGSRWLVVEFKVARSESKSEELLLEAIGQIKKNRYGEDRFEPEILRIAMVYSTGARRFTHWAEVPIKR